MIIKISYMGNFLFSYMVSAQMKNNGKYSGRSQLLQNHSAAQNVPSDKKGKKITHSLRYDRPDGRLSSIILHVVHPLIRQSYDRYVLYIPDVVVECQEGKNGRTAVGWKICDFSAILKRDF